MKILHKFWPIIICLTLASFVAWPTVMPGYFSHHDDLQVMRIFEMKRCLMDLQIPCRWVPDMGYGNGYPLFNYYGVLPYYIGPIFSFLLGFLTSAKLLFAIPIFLGAISMYFLAKELFGVLAGILSSVLFIYAPYHALDLYVRGDIAESFAISIIPFCFYFALKLIKSGKVKYLTGLSVSLGLFLISHNIMSVLFMPVLMIFIIYWLILEKRNNLRLLATGLALGVGLSAFFILPAYFEKNLVQIDNLIRLDLNFRAHFATFPELFLSRFWGYGASIPGPNDTISFQVGWPQWWFVPIALAIFIFKFRSKRSFKDFFPILLVGVFLVSVFMTHIKSSFIWEEIDILKFTQFPWRFLSVTAFSTALLGGYVIWAINGNLKKYALAILIVLTIFLNWSYFKPKEFYFNLTDQQKLSGKLWDDQQKAAILDYLPISAVEPREKAPNAPIIVSGKANVQGFENKSNEWKFMATVADNATIEVPTLDFPKWKVSANSKTINYTNKNYLGRVEINFPKRGEYLVSGKFTNTPIRILANIISLLSIISLFYFGFYGKNYKFFR